MELRAADDTDVAEDLTPPLAPIAASLHDRFLHSHCSSCFLPLPKIPPPSQNTPPPIPSCSLCTSVRYCSSRCSDSDLPIHISSSECLLLLQSHPSTCPPSADVRAALRLLRSLRTLPSLPGRLGGLFTGSLRELLRESGSETGTRIRQGAELMNLTRSGGSDDEEAALAMWAVMANAVEVQVGEGAPLGVAVYGPGFSWFNHSCLPNACYRFERHGPSGSGGFRVVPAGFEEPPDMWKMWVPGESKLNDGGVLGLCIYGPRIIVRSIKPIKKGEEVFITYTDLLQPKATRHLDLWLKYRFLCRCERCLASPEMYIDHILNCDARNMDSNHDFSRDADCDEQADFLDETISEYMSNGTPEVCCEKIESMLSKTFKYCQFQEESSTFWLHPLHHISLSAYITLASAYRTLGNSMIATSSGEDGLLEAIKTSRGGAAYSLLLAGVTHHLFLSESSLIQSAAVFWVNAGESIMDLVRSSCGPELDLISQNSQFMPVKDPFLSMDYCKATSMRFHEYMLSHLTKSWMYLAEGFSYLENIESPIDFSWLGTKISKILTGTDISEQFGCRCRAKTSFGEDMKSLFQIAVYCLTYGRFLANICYGPRCYLLDKVGDVLSTNPLSIG